MSIGQTSQQLNEDFIYTLIQTIVSHFVCVVNAWQDRTQAMIMKLKCQSLTHYRWYKDTFMALVYQRHDNSSEFWKERFTAGLPPLFPERIRN